MSMTKWYAVQVETGREDAACALVLRAAEAAGLADAFDELFNPKRRTLSKVRGELAEGLEAVQGPAEAPTCALMDLYAASLRRKIVEGAGAGERPLEGLHILVDAGNGPKLMYLMREGRKWRE